MKKILRNTLSCALLWSLAAPVAADYEDGVNAAFAGDFDTAFREFSEAAEAGLDLAQYNLAILYFTGQGVDQSLDLAFKWTEAAAVQGHTNAQFNLASLYMDGNGVDKNVGLALDWFAIAGRSGHGTAAFALAKMYQEGDPIDTDLVQAHAWASQANHNQHEEALALRQELEEDMSLQQLSTARRLYAQWQIESLPPILPR